MASTSNIGPSINEGRVHTQSSLKHLSWTVFYRKVFDGAWWLFPRLIGAVALVVAVILLTR